MESCKRWLDWAVELQSLAQAGLAYGKDPFDLERYARIREIAAEMLAHMADIPLEKVKDLFSATDTFTSHQPPGRDHRPSFSWTRRIFPS